MNRYLLAGLLASCASPAAAQLNMPAQLTYSIPDPVPSAPPEAVAASAALPAVTETIDVASLLTTAGVSVHTPTDDAAEVKARFSCVESGRVARTDQIRLPGLDPAGHLHKYFGLIPATADITTYAAIRNIANQFAAAGKQVSTCSGDGLNGSLYWLNTYVKPNALGDGVGRGKRYDYVTLYYTSHKGEVGKLWPLMPGQAFVFGRNMDDPNMTAMQRLVDAAQAANPSLQLHFDGTRVGGYWSCVITGDRAGSLAKADGSPAFICPATSRITQNVSSYECWSGKLSTPDGYSVSIPAVESGVDGKGHCPAEFPYHQLRIDTIVSFSHMGPDDYKTWRSEADDHMGMVLGRPALNGEAVHQDYKFGWMKLISDIWQCYVGVPIAGKDCSVPHELDYSTIGPDENGVIQKLISDGPTPNSGGKPLVDLRHRYYGSKLSDWTVLPGISKASQKRGNLTIEVR